jgi:MoaA/NifB/PqqE/SkfB family radical SAM enzyme
MVSNLERIERIKSWFLGKSSLPFKAVLIPTNRCNLNCPYCPNALPRSENLFKSEDELSKKEWEKCVKEGLELGIKEWSIIGGGEPLLRKGTVIPLVEIIKKYDTDCEIITNGTLLEKDDIKKLVEIGIDRILFSIDGPNAKIHDSLRGVKGAFKKVKRNIEFLSKLKKKFKKEKPYIKINMVLSKANFKKIDEMVKFVKKIGGNELALHPMREYYKLPLLKSFLLKDSLENDLKESIEKAKILAEKLKIFLNTDMVRIEKNVQKKEKKIYHSILIRKINKCNCFEPFYTILIDPNGFVAGCSPAGKGIKSLNVKEKSLKEIWFSEELSQVRKKIMAGQQFNYCSKCGLTDMRMRIKNDLLESVKNEKV